MQSHERIIMFIITGLSNLWCFPCLYVVYHRKMLFVFMTGIFTFVCSFMYHSMESLEINKFYLTASQWHRVDNIGSILSLINLFVFLMDNLDYIDGVYISKYETNIDRALCYSGLFLTLFMQTKHPWDLENTIIPVALYLFILIGKVLFIRKPRLNHKYFVRAWSIMVFGFICFYKGLDDANDYLRIWHGIWHFCGSAALFYFYQSIHKDKPLLNINIETSKSAKNYRFLPVLIYIFTFGWYKKSLIE
ncbi:hypothetical protein SteCoe_15663 [Stentor coeruleus]|uniref:Post-GPI attachment to proteins factor 3 n=1 Tax=Stentor coeruleus TaxID=5963 RepID=A0A1R2C2Z8_9CILI|nr:hypothetical protein SteCoe_15663 [Stentor coeruleus]